jgi:hypothetical protein
MLLKIHSYLFEKKIPQITYTSGYKAVAWLAQLLCTLEIPG